MHIKHKLLYTHLLALLFVIVCSCNSRTFVDSVDDFTFANLEPGCEKDVLLKKYGQPANIEYDETIYSGNPGIYHYNDFDVYVRFDTVGIIYLKNRKLQTKRGIKVGDSISKLKKVYSSAEYDEYYPSSGNPDKRYIYEYRIKDSNNKEIIYSIHFSVEKNKIIQISSSKHFNDGRS